MNISSAHWHLLLNHFPIVLGIISPLFLILSFIFKKVHMRFAGLLLLLFAAGFSYPASKTGAGAEEAVEKTAGISQTRIHKHEEAAKTGMYIMYVAGGLSLVSLGLLSLKKKAANTCIIITLLSGLVAGGYMSYVGYTGGMIKHPEIQEDFSGILQQSTFTNNMDEVYE
jgi:uncharacterized membrane protein